jgi:APA family basic amino acid/polyamine antiporter
MACVMETETASAREASPEGPRFGLATATFVVVSSMIGTGVLTTSGFTVYFVGSNQLMLALWVIGGVLALCGALTLCELSAALPRSGGDYVFLSEAYGPLAAFLSGWVSFLIGFGGPIAASASAAAKYLLAPLRLGDAEAAVAQPAVASAAIVALGVVHCLGRGTTIRAQGGMTVLKLGILAVLAVAGLAAGWGRWENLADRPPLTPSLVVTMASSLVYISYAYTGWNAASYVAGEVDRPQQRMPRAILLGTGLVLALYLALNTAYALALSAGDVRAIVGGPENVNAIAPIAQIAADHLYGPRVADPLSVAIGLTLLASVSAYILTGPRVAYAMARAGQFPEAAGRLSARGVPAVATALQVAWSLVLLWTASFERILVYSGVGLAVFSMLTVTAVYVLRRRRPDLPRPFRTPGYPLVPAVYLAGTGLLTAAVCYERPVVSSISLLSIAAGVPVYYLWAAGAPRRPTAA